MAIHRHESQRLLFFSPRAAFLRLRTSNELGRGALDWEIIADNLSKAGWSWGYVSAI